jgi:glycosyltransferase 2 family protein
MIMARHLSTWGRAFLGLVVVGLVLWKVLPSGWSDHFNASFLVAGLAIQPVAMFGLIPHAIRLGILAGLPASRPGRPLAALLLSQGLNLLLPGRVAEFFKASYLHSHAGVPVSQGMAAVFLERSVDLVIVAGLSLVSLALFATGTATWAWMAAGTLLFGLMLAPVQEERLARMVSSLPWPVAATFAERFCRHVSRTVREQVFFRALALGVLTWVFSLLNVYVFIQIAGSHPVDAKGALALFVATTIGGAVPGLPGGFGAYEAGAVLALRPYGYDTGEALAIGLALHLSQFVIPLFASGVILARERTGISHLLRRLRDEFSAQKGGGRD